MCSCMMCIRCVRRIICAHMRTVPHRGDDFFTFLVDFGPCLFLRRYLDEGDLAFFKAHMEQNVVVEGASAWAPLMNRDFGSFTYTAWRRILPVSRRPASYAPPVPQG